MNKENQYPHLTVWCKDYHSRSGLKIHPSSVPTDVVLDELLGQAMASMRHIQMITSTLELITERFNKLNQDLKDLQDMVEKFNEAREAKETKKVKK
jgi:hypothetical protein